MPHEQKRSDIMNDEARMTNDKGSPNAQMATNERGVPFFIRICRSFVIRHSSFQRQPMTSRQFLLIFDLFACWKIVRLRPR
jgi:hypothetical protein